MTKPEPTSKASASPRAPGAASVEVPFAVPFVHRFACTRDVLGADSESLLALFEASGEAAPKVQVWVDEGLVASDPTLLERIAELGPRAGGRIELLDPIHAVPGGEAVKNDFQHVHTMLEAINAADLDRRSYMLVIGGGAVLDAVGFAAAIAHRGIRLIRLPTTTLAQADSGVGVKNSVNAFGKKNWIGTFAVPWGVINDEGLLRSLPDRDYRCGFAEAVKVSLLKDPRAFEFLCTNARRIAARDPAVATPAIENSLKLHLDHITRGGDPFEALEARPLDYGHWSAHRLEPMTTFEVRHGEAVAIGVAVDTVYSTLAHGLAPEVADRVLGCLDDLGLTLWHPKLAETEALFQGLEEFRQHLGGRLTLTMLRAVGDPLDVHEVDRPKMLAALERVSAHVAARGGASA